MESPINYFCNLLSPPATTFRQRKYSSTNSSLTRLLLACFGSRLLQGLLLRLMYRTYMILLVRIMNQGIKFIFESTSRSLNDILLFTSPQILRQIVQVMMENYADNDHSRTKDQSYHGIVLLLQLLEQEGDKSRWKSEGFLWCIILLLATVTTTIVSNQVSFLSFSALKSIKRAMSQKQVDACHHLEILPPFLWFSVAVLQDSLPSGISNADCTDGSSVQVAFQMK